MKRIAVQMELAWPVRRHYDVLAGIYEYAASKDDWIIETSRFPELRMEQGIRFDGIVGRIEPEMHMAAKRAGLPLVNVWMNSPIAKDVVNVHADLRAAAAIAAEHLVARGLRHLAHVSGEEPHLLSYNLGLEGVQRVAVDAGCTCRAPIMAMAYENSQEEWRELVRIVHEFMHGASLPIGVVVCGDMFARGISQIILDMGYKIPEDVSIVSTGNESVAAVDTGLTLSSVDMGFDRVGYMAAQQLDRILMGDSLPLEAPPYLPPKELIVRRSSDAYSVKDEAVALALKYMVDHVNTVIGVPDIVREAGIGRQALERKFNKQVGRTINAELMRLRVERLKRLLSDTDTPIALLRKEAGFGTAASMFSTFKRATGKTPREYREAHGDVVARRFFVNSTPQD